MGVYVFAPARNEAENMAEFAESLLIQTTPPNHVTIINDGSTDDTGIIARNYGFHVIDLPYHSQSYFSNVAESHKISQVLNNAFPPPSNCEYMMQTSPDMIHPPRYIEILTERMNQDKTLVIASGRITGEYSANTSPRGAGRIYKVSFWNKYVHKYPLDNTWESYPCYKAWTLGYKTANFADVPLYTQRKTAKYKPHYGRAMAQLGYFPVYALLRCFLPIIKECDCKMLLSYLQSPSAKHEDIKNFLYWRQSRNLVGYMHHPLRFLKNCLERR